MTTLPATIRQNLVRAAALPLPNRIAAAIAEAGGEARLIGGVVRDILSGMEPATIGARNRDLDMATTLKPHAAMEILAAAGLKAIPTGIDHGTITVLDAGDRGRDTRDVAVAELTTLREDVETDGRHARVRFGTGWRADAMRRDFTINTMSITRDGTLYDPFGGYDDLVAGRVRFIGDARARIMEDYLRIMRFFRFHARFGAGAPNGEAMEAIAEHVSGLDRISGERMGKELCGILWEQNPDVLLDMQAAGVDRAIAPQGFTTGGDCTALIDYDLPPLAWLGFHIKADDWQAVATRLRLSNAHSAILEFMTKPIDIGRLEKETWAQAAWYLTSRVRDGRVLACQYVLTCARNGEAPAMRIYRRLAGWQKPALPIRGEDFRARGIPGGKKLGAMLTEAEAAWVESGFRLSRAALLRKVVGAA